MIEGERSWGLSRRFLIGQITNISLAFELKWNKSGDNLQYFFVVEETFLQQNPDVYWLTQKESFLRSNESMVADSLPTTHQIRWEMPLWVGQIALQVWVDSELPR